MPRSDPRPKLLQPLTSEVARDSYTFDDTDSDQSVRLQGRKSTGSSSFEPNKKRKMPITSDSQKPKLNLTNKKSNDISNERTESQKSSVLYKRRSKEVVNEDMFEETADGNNSTTSDGSQRRHEERLNFKIPNGMKFRPMESAVDNDEISTSDEKTLAS